MFYCQTVQLHCKSFSSAIVIIIIIIIIIVMDKFGRIGQFVTYFSNHINTGFSTSHSPNCWMTYVSISLLYEM